MPHAQLNVSSLTPSLLLTEPSGAADAPWSVSVSPLATRECGALLAARWVACGGGVLAEAEAELFVQLPAPVAVRITMAEGLTLAPHGDLATLGGIGVPWSASFSAVVDFVDPASGAATSRDFTTDARTSFNTSLACARVSANQVSVLAAGCDGAQTFEVTATVRWLKAPNIPRLHQQANASSATHACGLHIGSG